MKTIFIAIIPMIVLALLEIVLGEGVLTQIVVDYKRFDAFKVKTVSRTATFDLDIATYGITFLTVIGASVIWIGLNVLATGFVSSAVKVGISIVLYVAIWTLLSILALDLLFLNKMVGGLIYMFLCLIYIIGVFQVLSGSE